MLLIDRFRETAASHPEAAAFIAGERPLSYRASLALLGGTVRFLHEQGVAPGEVIGLTLPQSPQHLLVMLALARLGAVSVAVPPIPDPVERAALLAEFRVARMISDREDAAVPGIPMLRAAAIRAREDEGGMDSGAFVPSGKTPMRIGFTSGTAGRRKGVLLTHEAFMRRLDRRFYGPGASSRVLPPALHLTSALQLALHALCTGGTVIFPADYDAASIVAAIRRHGVTHITMPPSHLLRLLDSLPPGHVPFPSLQHVRLLGATPSRGFIERVRGTFSPHVCIPYSTAEVGVMAMATPETLAIDSRSAGRAVPGARIEIVDAEGRPVAAGVSGEIRAQVDGMPGRYAGEDQGTPPRFRDGWFYPQDRGHLDARGYLFVEGRLDDVMNVGGRKVTPRYVEAVLEDFPGVREAAVFADVEGPEGGRVAAAIVASAPVDLPKLAAYAAKQLGLLAPSRYIEVESLPRNSMGKLIRSRLEPGMEGTPFAE